MTRRQSERTNDKKTTVSERRKSCAEVDTTYAISPAFLPSAEGDWHMLPARPWSATASASGRRVTKGARFSFSMPDSASFRAQLNAEQDSTRLLMERQISASSAKERRISRTQRNAFVGKGGSAVLLGEAAPDEAVKERLVGRRLSQNMTAETLEHIKNSILEHSVSSFLEAEDVNMIAKSMEYFAFKAGEVVIGQGETETHLMVALDATIKVALEGGDCSELACGVAFGSSALLCGRTRTSTVYAMVDCGIWGADGAKFRETLRETASRSSKANVRLLENIDLFNGFSSRQCDLVSRVVHVERFAKGELVVEKGSVGQGTELPMGMIPTLSERRRFTDLGEEATLWCVKKGCLRAIDTDTGEEVTKFHTGNCFGERGLLYQEGSPYSVYAEDDSELLCICNSHLKPLLGKDVVDFMTDHIVNSALRKGPVCANYSQTQRDSIAQQFQFISLDPQEPLASEFVFVVVVTGEIVGRSQMQNDNPARFQRGQFHSTLSEDMHISESTSVGGARLSNFVAGPDGAFLGILPKAGFAQALGVGEQNGAGAVVYTRVLLALRKVPLFRHLSQDQIWKLARSFVTEKRVHREFVIEQGSIGSSFYVLDRGTVEIRIGGKLIRTMAKNSYFGERALLFNEPRTASVQVITEDGADLWSVDNATFDSVITENMRQEIMRRILREDTKAKLADLRIVRGIGCGASGVVKLAEHRTSGTRYALKAVDKQDAAMVKEVRRECALLRENDHPFIMNVVKTFETERRCYMLTELVTGGDMHGAIRQIPNCLTRSQASFYTASIVIVLEALWDRNVVFRDLKPENVMIDMQGYIKLIDFGAAKKVGSDGRAFTTIGTPHYMAPEVVQSKGYGCGCDLWSLGVMLYEFVIGYLPFGNDLEDPSEVFAAVAAASLTFPDLFQDPTGRALLQGLLEFDPAKRLGTGIHGYEDVRRAEYFQQPGGKHQDVLFNQIMGRELVAPHVPQAEIFDSDNEDEGSDSEDSCVSDLSCELVDEEKEVETEKKKLPQASSVSSMGSAGSRVHRLDRDRGQPGCCSCLFAFASGRPFGKK